LWTDGARKARFLALPPGAAIDARDPDAWSFPVGTRPWKEFAFERRVETRNLERAADGWLAATYVGDAAGTDAVLAPVHGVRGAAWSQPGVPYDVPGRADCRACHDGRATPVLGVSALPLSSDRDPLAPHAEPLRPDDLDLDALVRAGLVVGLPDAVRTRGPRVGDGIRRGPRQQGPRPDGARRGRRPRRARRPGGERVVAADHVARPTAADVSARPSRRRRRGRRARRGVDPRGPRAAGDRTVRSPVPPREGERPMKRYFWIPVALLPAVVVWSIASAGGARAAVARGLYLVTVGVCADCHTSKTMGPNGPLLDLSRWLAGHPEPMEVPPAPTLPEGPWIATTTGTLTAWSGPWGTSFSANLTPDVETGLGAWTEETFIETIRAGRHQGRGRPLLPPMPAERYAQMTEEDLRAVFAYLRTIPAVTNRVPAPRAPADASMPPPSPAADARPAPTPAK